MIKDFLDGSTSYVKAIHLISKMRLWKFILVPGIISLLLGGGIGLAAWGFSDNLGNWLISWYPFDMGIPFLTRISVWIGIILIVAFGLILYKHLILVLMAPFMSPLSQKVEEHLTGKHTNYKGFQWSRAAKEFFRGLHLAIRNIIREVLLVVPLLLCSFIPAVGIFPAILIFIIQAYYAGFGNMDYTLERHYSVKDSVRFIRKHRGLAIGNGTVFMLLLMTGFGFLFAPPLAAVAGTVETVKRLNFKDEFQPLSEDFV